MARILNLSPPYQGMSSVVNVNQRVGPDENNNSDDVRVIQRLLQLASKGAGPRAASIGVPQVSGNFDAATGFWIYYTQDWLKGHGNSGQVVDGVVSPAHGSAYGPKAIWTIVLFNHFAKLHSPAEYPAFLAQSGP